MQLPIDGASAIRAASCVPSGVTIGIWHSVYQMPISMSTTTPYSAREGVLNGAYYTDRDDTHSCSNTLVNHTQSRANQLISIMCHVVGILAQLKQS